MNSTIEFLLALIVWMIFISVLCAQLIKNFRSKCSSGISDQFLFGCLNLNGLCLLFIFSRHISVMYEMMGVVTLCFVCALIVQRIVYHVPDSLLFFYGVLINCTALLMSAPYLLLR